MKLIALVTGCGIEYPTPATSATVNVACLQLSSIADVAPDCETPTDELKPKNGPVTNPKAPMPTITRVWWLSTSPIGASATPLADFKRLSFAEKPVGPLTLKLPFWYPASNEPENE